MRARTKVAPAVEPGQALHDAAGKSDDHTTRTQVTQAAEFFRHLYGESARGFLAITSIKPKPGARNTSLLTAWYAGSDLSGAAGKAVQLAAQGDVFFSLGLHREAGDAHHRGAADGVLAVPGVWIDLDIAGATHGDVKKNYFPDQAQALAFLAALPLRPSLIVASGGGLHVYWIFRELWVFEDDAERADAAALVEGWQAYIRAKAKAAGYDVDPTADLSRILRIPGTHNHKASPPLRVEILESTGERYTQGDFAEWTAPTKSDLPGAAGTLTVDPNAAAPRAKLEALLQNDSRFRLTWENKRPDLSDQSPSGYCLALANIAVGAGLSDQEVCNLLVQWRREHGATPKYPGWYARTIAKAREALGQPPGVEPHPPGCACSRCRAERAREHVAGCKCKDCRAEARRTERAEAERAEAERERAESTLPPAERLRAKLVIPGFEVVGAVRRGRAGAVGAHYDLILHRVDGAEPRRVEIPLGDATSLLSFRCASAAIFDAADGEVLPAAMAKRWREVAQLISRVATVVETTTEGEEVTGWAEAFLESATIHPLADVFAPRAYVGEVRGAFKDEAGLRYVHLPALRGFIARHFYVPTTVRALAERISRLGWEKAAPMQKRIDGRMKKVQLWREPRGEA